MCGILFICYKNDSCSKRKADELFTNLKENLQRRGPDEDGEAEIQLSNNWNAKFYGSTLWLQGKTPSKQPLIDSLGNILLWNGDIFYGFPDFPSADLTSDGHFLLTKLQLAENIEEICTIFHTIKGPHSFLFYHKKLNVFVMGKDRFGRHSLLWNYRVEESTGLFALSSIAYQSNFQEVPATELYAINLSDELVVTPLSARKSYAINKQLPSDDKLMWGEECGDRNSHSRIYQLYRDVWNYELELFEKTLYEAIKIRAHCQPPFCKLCINSCTDKCNHSKLAVLFSGGLDSTVLAAMVDQMWPVEETIDLLNVAFLSKGNFDVPDRLTGLQGLDELHKLNPDRKWNFVKVNVPVEELIETRASNIAPLINPASTVLDDSIGCAQWFAARGEGTITDQFNEEISYTSPARVILMGAGADEQMAGYSRHRQRFANGGWSALASEIEMEMNRIPQRNLGRDNRMIADHGRAPRLPYLDENVVDCLSQLPICAKVDLRLPLGVGDKIILRVLAFRLGLIRTATEPKRAIQFGSRIAKAEARKEKGHQCCDRLITTQ